MNQDKTLMRVASVVITALTLFIYTNYGWSKSYNDRPNVVVILADDMGYGDIQSLNPHSKIPTPNLDGLAKSGMRFIDAHSPSAVCTPTRYGLVTGRYCWRTNLKRGVLNGYSKSLIDPNRFTLADLFRNEGYRTGVIGKWHLGLNFAKSKESPNKFDFSKPIGNSPNVNGFSHSEVIPASLDFPPYVWVKNDRIEQFPSANQSAIRFPGFLRKGERSPDFHAVKILDQIASKASDFISTSVEKSKPFFLYIPLTSPHKPVLPADRFVGKSGLGLYGDFIIQTDWTVGQILNAVKKNKIENNTIVIFTSDNGSFMYRKNFSETEDHVSDETIQAYNETNHRSNFIFRGTKADVFEGGHRVPFLVKWPGTVRGGSISERTTCHVDILATLAEILNTKLEESAADDSFSFLDDLLEKESKALRPPVINHSANGTFAIRYGSMKLILSEGSGGREKPSSKPFQGKWQLYDLNNDPREQVNLIDDFPQIAKKMESQFKEIQNGDYSRFR